jgi:hypothetical protein
VLTLLYSNTISVIMMFIFLFKRALILIIMNVYYIKTLRTSYKNELSIRSNHFFDNQYDFQNRTHFFYFESIVF